MRNSELLFRAEIFLIWNSEFGMRNCFSERKVTIKPVGAGMTARKKPSDLFYYM